MYLFSPDSYSSLKKNRTMRWMQCQYCSSAQNADAKWSRKTVNWGWIEKVNVNVPASSSQPLFRESAAFALDLQLCCSCAFQKPEIRIPCGTEMHDADTHCVFSAPHVVSSQWIFLFLLLPPPLIAKMYRWYIFQNVLFKISAGFILSIFSPPQVTH